MMQEKRGMMRVWNVWLVFTTFMLTIFGTFLTRSGVVSSVHAFA
jgi:cytochrome c-type biogenesis protein CcmF